LLVLFLHDLLAECLAGLSAALSITQALHTSHEVGGNTCIVACLPLACLPHEMAPHVLQTCYLYQSLSTPAAQLTSFSTDLSALLEISPNCSLSSYTENLMTKVKMSKICFQSIQSAIILSQDQRMAHCISMHDYQVLARLYTCQFGFMDFLFSLFPQILLVQRAYFDALTPPILPLHVSSRSLPQRKIHFFSYSILHSCMLLYMIPFLLMMMSVKNEK
jgi:hypothetical protein